MSIKHSVIIPLSHPWDWTSDYQRQTGLFFSSRNHQVYAIECFKQPLTLRRWVKRRPSLVRRGEGGIYLVKMLHPIPFDRFSWIYQLNQLLSIVLVYIWIMIKVNWSPVILWLFHPQFSRFLILKRLFRTTVTVIYDCIDLFIDDGGRENQEYISNENKMLHQADKVVAVSLALYHRLQTVRRDVVYVRQGFRLNEYADPIARCLIVKKNLPIIGYIGAINHRLNYDLLIPLIKNNPQWQFVFWGPIQYENDNTQVQTLLNLPNVIHGESADKREVPSIVSQFTVGIIPYTSTLFNQYCSPEKLFEYFYFNLPVVSSAIEEVKLYPEYVRNAVTLDEWQKCLDALVSNQKPTGKPIKIALSNSFPQRIEKLYRMVNTYA